MSQPQGSGVSANLVIERAEREGIQQVAVLRHDLLSALTGHPIMVSTLDGTEVALRLMTADEFMERNRAAVAKYNPGGELASRERAIELTQSTPDYLIWGPR